MMRLYLKTLLIHLFLVAYLWFLIPDNKTLICSGFLIIYLAALSRAYGMAISGNSATAGDDLTLANHRADQGLYAIFAALGISLIVGFLIKYVGLAICSLSLFIIVPLLLAYLLMIAPGTLAYSIALNKANRRFKI